MKLENFKQCAEIVDKIKQLQKSIDSINESEYVSFINCNHYPLFDINTNNPNQSQSIYECAVGFKLGIISYINQEIKELSEKLETL